MNKSNRGGARPGAGRPSNPGHKVQRQVRRFYMLEKTPETDVLMLRAKAVYRSKQGSEPSNQEIMRIALAEYVSRN